MEQLLEEEQDGQSQVMASPGFMDLDHPLVPADSVKAHRLSNYRQEEEFIRYALDSAAIVAITDVQGTITYINGKFCEISGYSQEELIGSNHRMLRSGAHDKAFFKAMYREIAQGRIWHGEICNQRKDGSFYWVDTTIVPHISAAGKVDSYTAIRFDISQRKQMEEELRASKERLHVLANLDPLTNLANRRQFQDYIEALVADGRPAPEFHLALMDVDSFKEVNDSFGHDAGDLLLQTVATRLTALTGDGSFISRLGGDEFGLILHGATDEEAHAFFEQVLEAIREPIAIGASSRRCSASVGVAIFPRHATDAASLFKAADMALYHAKSLGRDGFELFQPKLKEAVDRRSATLAEIESGLLRDEFDLHYQPIVPNNRTAVSLEALMRWRHPTLGLLTPAAFLAGFEDPAMRATLGAFMLERVFRDVRTLLDRGMALKRVAMNLTNSDFRSEVFLDRFFQLCRETGIGPDKFCVEVTEGMFLGRDQKRVDRGLRRLHEAGVEVALDDFGTGFASLTHLRQLPIDRLKIDRSFIANLVASPEDQAIVSGVIDIAHSLGKVVTAEGVETLDQVELLLRMECDLMQGWYFSKACPVETLPEVVRTMRRIPAPASLRWATG